jgi:hypothetical protein
MNSWKRLAFALACKQTKDENEFISEAEAAAIIIR